MKETHGTLENPQFLWLLEVLGKVDPLETKKDSPEQVTVFSSFFHFLLFFSS